MAEITNEFAWSVSRHRAFHDCLRMYYLAHYAFWGGWEWGASELARKCYRFTKMKNLDMWAGEVVHAVIEWTLRRLWERKPVTEQDLRARAISRLREGWKESKGRQWEQDPKRRLNLFEHYYGIEVPPERTEEIKGRVLRCLENFWASEVFAFIRSVDRGAWKAIERIGTFHLNGVKVWVKIDFALAHQEKLYVYDWKSGQEDAEDLQQLTCYALYAMERWAIPHDRIRIVPVYLQDGTFREHTLRPEEVIEAKEEILQSIARMRARLVDPERNLARPEDFPMTTETWRCQRCFFQEICYGGRYTGT
ncbi:MAG: PD-(D/E)XK nuclease family protein [Blastocatellia bacterium]|nr:PD-(D/E)XK nuclease family protein [Blastocatellia bacterium]MCS7158246.1 PD-(D/E)XK nuclease family protein [Blastocatellia bacterium]MCX7753084.1 PD-(D/E)XK nuclease family protein [Blastocatellia bacterium]MDW8169400.1 PD-(D/E)XK nuclease family protein [Acidobacteriota bacterium]MDW8256467.1 PD-(D/E)XK nuclease family protein [Acidobacteriota bacterium]